MNKMILSALLVSLLAACSSTEVKDEGTKAPVVDGSKGAATQTSDQSTTKPLPPQTVAANPLKDPNNILSKRSVYYDYDSAVIKDEFKPLVTAHARYLTQNRSARMVIQGNTDERGSREYNLALGQRRADSVKQMMMLLGVQESKIETVSFGEEKPRAAGKDEASYSENRRSDIVYAGEQ